jgi:hypothetical protein
VARIERDTVVAVAAFVGPARLIDNVTISIAGSSGGTPGRVTVDYGLVTAGSAEDR